MVEIEFNNGTKIKCILLGKYQRQHKELQSYQKRCLWKNSSVYITKTIDTYFYIILIPWKHREKQIVEINERNIVNSQSIKLDESWIKVDEFISETLDGSIYPLSMKVNDFVGYKFIYENNSFIINLSLHDECDNLSVLYRNMPELLDVNLENKEE